MSLLRTIAVRAAAPAVRNAARSMSYFNNTTFSEELTKPLTAEEEASGDWVEVRVPVQESTLEWVLSSPPPLHAFDEPPLYHECTEDAACTWHNPLAH